MEIVLIYKIEYFLFYNLIFEKINSKDKKKCWSVMLFLLSFKILYIISFLA